jgi:hypothetical protein
VLILCARYLDGDGAVYFDEFDFVAHLEPKEPSGAIPMTGVNRTMAEKLRAGKICESKP